MFHYAVWDNKKLLLENNIKEPILFDNYLKAREVARQNQMGCVIMLSIRGVDMKVEELYPLDGANKVGDVWYRHIQCLTFPAHELRNLMMDNYE